MDLIYVNRLVQRRILMLVKMNQVSIPHNDTHHLPISNLITPKNKYIKIMKGFKETRLKQHGLTKCCSILKG